MYRNICTTPFNVFFPTEHVQQFNNQQKDSHFKTLKSTKNLHLAESLGIKKVLFQNVINIVKLIPFYNDSFP